MFLGGASPSAWGLACCELCKLACRWGLACLACCCSDPWAASLWVPGRASVREFSDVLSAGSRWLRVRRGRSLLFRLFPSGEEACAGEAGGVLRGLSSDDPFCTLLSDGDVLRRPPRRPRRPRRRRRESLLPSLPVVLWLSDEVFVPSFRDGPSGDAEVSLFSAPGSGGTPTFRVMGVAPL